MVGTPAPLPTSGLLFQETAAALGPKRFRLCGADPSLPYFDKWCLARLRSGRIKNEGTSIISSFLRRCAPTAKAAPPFCVFKVQGREENLIMNLLRSEIDPHRNPKYAPVRRKLHHFNIMTM